jgi:hypothetical protein
MAQAKGFFVRFFQKFILGFRRQKIVNQYAKKMNQSSKFVDNSGAVF